MGRISPIGFNDTDGIKCLIYGESGSGKTTLAATFPAPILWVIASGGVNSGELRSVDTPENRSRISSVVLNDSQELIEITQAVPSLGINTLVMDHVTGLESLILREVLGLEEIPAQRSWGLASQQQYGEVAEKMKEHARRLLNQTCNIVLIGQQRPFNGKGGEESNAEDGIKPTIAAAVMPSVGRWLFPACDYMVQCFKRPKMKEVRSQIKVGKTVRTQISYVKDKGIEYCVRTEPHEVYQTKFRVPLQGRQLPDAIVNPTYDDLMRIIRGEDTEPQTTAEG